jgi:hypothetical protein
MRLKPLVVAIALVTTFVALADDRPASPTTLPAVGPASFPATRTAAPATYANERRHDPNQSLHVVTVDLTDPAVAVGVARGGPDPDGDGKWTTTLLPVREVAEREHFDVAVNGDFFEAIAQKDPNGKSTGFARGKWGTPTGPAATDGTLWRAAPATRPALLVGGGRAAVAEVDPRKQLPAWVRQAIGGNVVLVRDGKVVPQKNKDRHPRTVAGVDASGSRLILLVVDGRQPKLSIGMTYEELGREMVRLGVADAVNLDGGGSTTLVLRDLREPATAAAAWVVANSPSDGRERAVADVLGVHLGRPVAATQLATRPSGHDTGAADTVPAGTSPATAPAQSPPSAP